jgi:hypothetical protein
MEIALGYFFFRQTSSLEVKEVGAVSSSCSSRGYWSEEKATYWVGISEIRA